MNDPSPGKPVHIWVSAIIVSLTGAAILFAYVMMMRAEARTNQVALAANAKPVSFAAASAASYRRSMHYVGTLRPWVEASVGPQFLSAYVETVLVRPGAKVKRGDVLATLDCRNANTVSTAVAMQARAIEAKQTALADEAQRQAKLLNGGYASKNEVERALAESSSQAAQLEAQKATLAHSSLEVRDCVLLAPFDGEVGDRFVDPGAFVRPGTAIVSIIDRSTVRFTGDVPEVDFELVAPTTAVQIRVDATRQNLEGTVARRAPHADGETRTVRFEVDLPNCGRSIPVDTTGEVTIGVGEPVAATAIPLYAATVRAGLATVFVLEGDVARARSVSQLGEIGGTLYVGDSLAPGSRVVTEGRALLNDGDRVAAKSDPLSAASSALTAPLSSSARKEEAR